MTLAFVFSHEDLVLHVEVRLVVLQVHVLGDDKCGDNGIFDARAVTQPGTVVAFCRISNVRQDLLRRFIGGACGVTWRHRVEQLANAFKVRLLSAGHRNVLLEQKVTMNEIEHV